MFPYTRISLNKKNCLCFGLFLQSFVKIPSPTSTRDTSESDFPEGPKHASTLLILRALISVFLRCSTMFKSSHKTYFFTAYLNRFMLIVKQPVSKKTYF